MLIALVLSTFAFASEPGDTTPASEILAATATHLACAVDPGPPECDGIHESLMAEGDYWFNDQCATVAQESYPQTYVAVDYEGIDGDTVCTGDVSDDDSGSTGGGTGSGGDPPCKSQSEAEGDAVPIEGGCDGDLVEYLRCEDTHPDPGQECFECWYTCRKAADIPSEGGIIQGEY